MRVTYLLFISLGFHNTKAAPIQKALGSAPLFKTHTSKVIHPLAASPPATPSCELQGGQKNQKRKKQGENQETIPVPEAPLGHHGPLWEEQDLPITPSSSYSPHLQPATESGGEADPKPRHQPTAPPRPYPAAGPN